MEKPAPDVARIIDVFDHHKVEYVVVGGIAAQAYGAARPTLDFDCLASRSSANLDRVAAALRELHARLRVEGLSDEEASELPVPLGGEFLARTEISTWRTDAGDFDVLADIPDAKGNRLRYEELRLRAKLLEVDGVTFMVAALEDVIASKEWADRPKDRAALRSCARFAISADADYGSVLDVFRADSSVA